MTHTIQDLIGSVQLQNVRLLRADTKTRLRAVGRIPAADLQLNRGVKILLRDEGGFRIGATFQAKIVATVPPGDDPSPGDPIAEFHLLYELHYTVESAGAFPDEVLLEFGAVNGVFNVWPYWREYIQTTAARMQLPPLIIPVFRVVQRTEEQQKQSIVDVRISGEVTRTRSRRLASQKKR